MSDSKPTSDSQLYAAMKSQLWAAKMSASMPHWNEFNNFVTLQFMQVDVNDAKAAAKMYAEIAAKGEAYKKLAHAVDDNYYAGMIQATILENARRNNVDLNAVKAGMTKATAPKKKHKAKKKAK